MVSRRVVSVGLLTIVLALASTAPQSANADVLADAQAKGQQVFQAAFDTWTESDLRSYLLDRGIISPASTKEQLVVLAKQDYEGLGKNVESATSAAAASASSVYSSVSSLASSFQSVAAASASSLGTAGSKSASSLSSDASAAASSASKSASSALASATKEVQKTFDANTDYVYSSWKDSELRSWLQKNGAVASDYPNRDALLKAVGDNWNTYTDTDTYWQSWTDSDLRNWLIANGYLKSNAEAKRDELLALAQKNGKDLAESSKSYLAWSDAKIREYLAATGLVSPPNTRDALLREMRARFIPQKGYFEQFKDGIVDFIAGAHGAAADAASTGSSNAAAAASNASKSAASAASSASKSASSAASVASSSASKIHSEL